MKAVLKNCIETFEKESNSLWQGKGADINAVTQAISFATGIIIQLMEGLSDEDKINTSMFLKNVMNDYENAIKNKDDFMLADCLHYQWREICIIYEELLEGDM
jgi:hypothetical protein